MATFIAANSTGGTGWDSSLTFALNATGADFIAVSARTAHASGISGVTYHGVALTRAEAGSTYAGMFVGYIAEADRGNYNVIVTFGGTETCDAAAACWYGPTNPTTPVDLGSVQVDAAATADPSVVVTSETGDFVVAVDISGDNPPTSVTPGTGENERVDVVYNTFNMHWIADQDGAASVTIAPHRNVAGAYWLNRLIAINVNVAASGPTVALTGTATASIVEADVVAGGKTIILTVTGDTWITAGSGAFDAIRADIINGLDSAQSEAGGWNAKVRDDMAVNHLTAVIRTSDTVVTITLPATADYNITATETITATIPASALTGAVGAVAVPTFTVSTGAASVAVTGTITATVDEADIRTGGKTLILTVTNDDWVADGATFNAIRDDILAGLTAASSPLHGWNNEVRDVEVVTAVVRTSDKIVTITFTAAPAYDVSQTETITVTVPAVALVGNGQVVATPAYTIDATDPATGAGGGPLVGLGGLVG